MSSRDQHNSSSSSRKRDRSTDGHSSRRPDKERGRSEKSRDHPSSHSTSRDHPSSKKDDSSSKRHRSSRQDSDEEAEKRRSARKDKDDDRARDRDRDHRSPRKSSRRDTDKDRSNGRHHRPSKGLDVSDNNRSGSESGSESGTGSEADSASEEDEMIKKAKSLIKTITEDDYFTKSAEFRLWLRKSKKKYFEDLSADDARRYFKKFVRAWNDFDLDESYYKGIRSSQLSSKDTTKYKWGFAKKIGEEDMNKVEAIRDSIDTMTNTRFAQEVSRLTGKSTASSTDSTSRRTLGPSLPPSMGPQGLSRRPMTADEVVDKEDRDHYNRLQQRAENRAYRKTKEAVLDELVPKSTGREAMLEKRRAQTEFNRRERSPDVELPEQDLMGGGDDYKSMLAAERRKKEARDAKRHGAAGADSPSVGPFGPSRGAAVSSVRDVKQQAYKEKEEKQLEAFRQLWAQTQAAKGL
ncbi:hypothetical protein BGZ58_003700 [Dissophora ornata]|nr:hypothetical protein BGZ58_003700 [Dissophora ornata]